MNIICKFNDEDTFGIDEDSIIVNMYNIMHFRHTFWENVIFLPNFVSDKGIDLLFISYFVYAADRLVLRKDAEDNWHRNITLYIPVLDESSLNMTTKMFEEMLFFLTGDSWEFKFRKRELTNQEKRIRDKLAKSRDDIIVSDTICMLSGGLDSFIGAIDYLEETQNKNIIFVGHYGGGKGTVEFQEKLKSALKEKYKLKDKNFINVYSATINGKEDTTRSRSFMFFSIAIAIATSMRKKVTLLIPENGFIALNVPITSTRLGSSSTRTTHPYYFKLFQNLLGSLGIDVELKNPYEYYTKGEMITNCNNQEFLIENLGNTMSCSSPDWGRMIGETEARHCGYCLPCMIRRASIKHAKIENPDSYRDPKFTLMKIAKTTFNSYKLGLENFDEKRAFLDIQSSGPINKNIDSYSDAYIRGVKEIKELLRSVK